MVLNFGGPGGVGGFGFGLLLRTALAGFVVGFHRTLQGPFASYASRAIATSMSGSMLIRGILDASQQC